MQPESWWFLFGDDGNYSNWGPDAWRYQKKIEGRHLTSNWGSIPLIIANRLYVRNWPITVLETPEFLVCKRVKFGHETFGADAHVLFKFQTDPLPKFWPCCGGFAQPLNTPLMSQHTQLKRTTAPDIKARKGGAPIVSLTSYHAHTAAIADKFVDFLLVGDSLGMVMHGFETTLPVPLDLMIVHGRAVMRGAKKALVVVDMPFGSYEESPAQAFRNAARVVKETECGAIKIEGGARMAETIHFLAQRGIPVMAHIGLTPQSINILGGFKAQGRETEQWPIIEADAKAVTEAGAFAVVLEAIAQPLADKITQSIAIPTIGIGASAACDGQILVMEDMLGLSPRVPRFVKEFGKVGKAIEEAIALYAEDVRERRFPERDHTYEMKK